MCWHLVNILFTQFLHKKNIYKCCGVGASKVAKTGGLKSGYVTLSLVPVILLISSLVNYLRQAHLEASQRFSWLYNLVVLNASAFSLLGMIVPM